MRWFSRVRKNARRLSFRSAGFARESEIREHGVVKSMAWPVFLDPGPALTGRPGMTAEFFRTLLDYGLLR